MAASSSKGAELAVSHSPAQVRVGQSAGEGLLTVASTLLFILSEMELSKTFWFYQKLNKLKKKIQGLGWGLGISGVVSGKGDPASTCFQVIDCSLPVIMMRPGASCEQA